MPNTTYCQSCGFPNAYTISKPNFCGKCATPLATASVVVPASPSTPAPIVVPRKETYANVPNPPVRPLSRREIEEQEMEEIPEIEKLNFRIEGSLGENHRTLSLEEAIFNNPKPLEAAKPVRGKRITKKNSKLAFEELMARAKSRTTSSEIGEN